MKSMSVLLCEGYYDRAFWKGALTRLGCVDIPPHSGASSDNWGESVNARDGVYRFQSPANGRQIRLEPCKNDDGVLSTAKSRLQFSQAKPLDVLVAAIDRDTYGGDELRTLRAIRSRLPSDSSAAPAARRWRSSGVDVHAVGLGLEQLPRAGVPEQQCLERIVCAALARAREPWALHVAHWLANRPDKPTGADHKSHAWSYMAGWFADHGADDFLQHLWRDEAIARELLRVLEPTGALEALEAPTGVDPRAQLRT